MKLGELMVRQGLLTEAQVAEVLAAQARRTEPFGSICERLFGIAPEVVEGAWVEQYSVLTEGLRPDFDRQDPSVLNVVTRRQAWQFRIVPVCWDEGSLVLTTTRDQMARALRFGGTAQPLSATPAIAGVRMYAFDGDGAVPPYVAQSTSSTPGTTGHAPTSS